MSAIMSVRTWTVENLMDLFAEQREQSIWENRKVTACPHNPDGEPYEDTVWYGSIREAWESGRWEGLIEAVNEPLTSAGLLPLTCAHFDTYVTAIETIALRIARAVIGTGRPILVAIDEDSGYTAVFCERASELEVTQASWRFYP